MGPEFRIKDLRFYIDGKELTGNITGPIKVKIIKAPVWKRIRAKIKKLFKKGIKTGTASFTLWKDKKTSKKKLITIDELIAEEKARPARKAIKKQFLFSKNEYFEAGGVITAWAPLEQENDIAEKF